MKDMEERKLQQLFMEPPREYSLAPLWFWNDGLKPEHLKWQLGEMVEKGIYEVVISSRLGIEIPYLSELWFQRFGEIAAYARKLGVKLWIYDEDNWPSGYAGGKVLAENPAYCGKHLKRKEWAAAGDAWEKEAPATAVCAFRWSQGWVRLRDGEQPVEGTRVLAFYQEDTRWHPAYHGGYYIDMLNPEAARCFLRHTHQEYKKRFSGYFGEVIKGFFVDEPGFYNNLHLQENGDEDTVPWTEDFPAYFQRQRGYDICSALPSLWEASGEENARVHRDFYDTLCRMYQENFLDILGDFCRENGLGLIGHLHYEEFARYQIRTQGNLQQAVRALDAAGLDRIDTNPEKIAEKYISSAAHVFGKQRVMSETYALSGWELTLEEMKRWLDYQYVRGVNMLVPHAFYASIEGERSRECPPSEFYQNPYWSYFRQLADYGRRLSYLLSQGVHRCHVALLDPIHAMQAAYTPDSSSRVDALDQEFQKLAMALLERQIDYDIIGWEQLLEGSFEHPKRITVGEESYGTLLVAENRELGREELRLLRRFVGHGGQVIFAEGLPKALEELKEEEGVLVLAGQARYKSFTYARDLMPVLHFLMKHHQIDLYLPTPEPRVKYLHRQIGGAEFYFIVNEGKEAREVWLEFPGEYSLERWDPQTGERAAEASEVFRYPQRYLGATPEGGEWVLEEPWACTRYRARLAEYGSVLLKLLPRAEEKGLSEGQKEKALKVQLPVTGPWQAVVEEREYCVKNPRLEETGEIYFSGTFSCRGSVEIPPQLAHGRAFLCAGDVWDCMEVEVNGEACGARCFAPYEVEITGRLCAGKNEIVLKITNSLLNDLRKLSRPGGIFGEIVIRFETYYEL